MPKLSAPKAIQNSSGMSRLEDARKKCPAPISGGPTQHTLQKVSGAGRSKSGAPTKNARKVQPKPKGDSGFTSTMIGKKK